MAETADRRPRVYVFYDFNCPWSYVGKLRADRLEERFDVEIVWCGWELHPTLSPEGRPLPKVDDPRAAPVEGPIGELAEELGLTFYWPPVASNTALALRGAEHARDRGPERFEAYHEAVFEAIWQEGRNVGDLATLSTLAEEAGLDRDGFEDAVAHPTYDRRVDLVREKADELGLTRRPTFVFGDHRIAGTEAFEASLVNPLEAFVDRWERRGPEEITTLAEDVGLPHIA